MVVVGGDGDVPPHETGVPGAPSEESLQNPQDCGEGVVTGGLVNRKGIDVVVWSGAAVVVVVVVVVGGKVVGDEVVVVVVLDQAVVVVGGRVLGGGVGAGTLNTTGVVDGRVVVVAGFFVVKAHVVAVFVVVGGFVVGLGTLNGGEDVVGRVVVVVGGLVVVVVAGRVGASVVVVEGTCQLTGLGGTGTRRGG